MSDADMLLRNLAVRLIDTIDELDAHKELVLASRGIAAPIDRYHIMRQAASDLRYEMERQRNAIES